MKNIFAITLILFSSSLYAQPINNGIGKTKENPFSLSGKKAIVYTTAENTSDRLTITDTLYFSFLGQPQESVPCVFVDPQHTFQTLIGIGGAITDASAETFYKLSKKNQEKILQDYYDPAKGIGYTLARTNINSCDFSSEMYSYVAENDSSLKTFSIKHDEKFRIPLIKAATKESGNRLTIFASPWSPPAWMKDNNDMLHGGHLLPKYYQSWANYFVKFINSYKRAGVNIWGVTVQNEPMAVQTWESCIYTAQQEKDFLKNALGLAFQRSGLQNKKIIIWDHNRGLMYQRASEILNDPAAAKYVWGVGFHWYVEDNFDNVKRVQEAFPQTHLLFTEGTNYPFNLDSIYNWHWGENYGKSMIHDLNNGADGWCDWNILLDQTGGPNHVGNFCFAPIQANTNTGELYYMNSYYYIGHFSKFIRPGAKRISTSSDTDKLLATAFLNKDGKMAVVVLNLTDEKIPYKLWIHGDAASETSLPHSIQTLVVE